MRAFYIGAALSLIGSFLIVVSHNYLVGHVTLFISNVLLIWFLWESFREYYRSLLLPTDESTPEKE